MYSIVDMTSWVVWDGCNYGHNENDENIEIEIEIS